MKFATTTAQDITVVRAILKLCQDHARVPPFGLHLQLRDINHILDGKPIDKDSFDPAEKERHGHFSNYCQAITSVMLMMRLCDEYYDMAQSVGPFPPVKMRFIRKARIGIWFGKFPFRLQCFIFKVGLLVLLLVSTFKKYKWIIGTISGVAGAYTWFKTHDLSAYVVMVTGVCGVVATAVMGFLNSLGSSES